LSSNIEIKIVQILHNISITRVGIVLGSIRNFPKLQT
jgi:hypothetical protein